MPPLVSVIIPTFDTGGRSKLLVDAVQSVRRQNYQDLEIIVVDDASPVPAESSLAEIKLKEPRLRIFTKERQGGVSSARNMGLTVSRGDWIALLDNDDEWKPSKLTRQLSFMQTHQLKVSVTDVELCSPGKRYHLRRNSSEEADWMITTGTGLAIGSSLMATTDIFAKVGPFNESFRRSEDWEWLLRLHLDGIKVGIMPEVGITCRISKKEHIEIENASLDLLRTQYQEQFPTVEARRAFRAAIDWKEARNKLASGRRISGSIHLAFAAMKSPLDFCRFSKRIWLDPILNATRRE